MNVVCVSKNEKPTGVDGIAFKTETDRTKQLAIGCFHEFALPKGWLHDLLLRLFSRAKEEFLQPLQAKSKSSSESTICMKIHIGRLFDCIWHANCNINELYIYCIYMYITDGCLHPYNTFSHYIHIPNDCNDFNIHHTSRNIQDIYMIYKYCVCHKGAWTVKGTVWTMSQQPPRQTSTSMPMILKDWCPEILG